MGGLQIISVKFIDISYYDDEWSFIVTPLGVAALLAYSIPR
jgi:hypothetical protein